MQIQVCLTELYTKDRAKASQSLQHFRCPSISAKAAMMMVAGFLFVSIFVPLLKAVFSASTLDA